MSTSPVADGAHRADVPLDPAKASTGQLVGELPELVTRLVRDEVRLAQAEVKGKAKKLGLGVGLFGGAGVLALLGLNALITAFGARAKTTLPARITLDVRTTPGLACGLSNPRQVELALTLILANACEAMPGEGRITIATFAVPPGDRGLQRPADGAVGITVTDTGHGMSPEMAARALAPFVTSREAGRGTGLAIVHGLVKRQNGTVVLDSKSGEGTVVRLVFPAVV